MGTCLSTQSTTRRTRRRGVSISSSAGEHVADSNNCGGRSSDDSVSQQQQGGSGSNSDSASSTSPAPVGSGPSITAGGNGERFPNQSGQEWAGVEQSSAPLLLSPVRENASLSNPLGGKGNADAQALLPMTHTRLPSPLVASVGDSKQQNRSRSNESLSQPFSPTPSSNTDNNNNKNSDSYNNKENSMSISHATNADDAVAAEGEEEGIAWTLKSAQRLDPQGMCVVPPLPTVDGCSSTAIHIHNPLSDNSEASSNEIQDADQLCRNSVEEERLDVSSAALASVVELSSAPQKRESAAAAAGGIPVVSTCNVNHQPLIGASLTSSGIYSGSTSSSAGGGGGGSGGGGDTGSRVALRCSGTAGGGGGSSFGHHQRHHCHHSESSPLAMIDVLRTNNPSGGSPSTTMLPGFESSPSALFSEAAGGRGGIDDGSGGASAHGDPQLGRSMYSSWDSSDCCRAQVSAANMQTTMQTVATASLFASRTS